MKNNLRKCRVCDIEANNERDLLLFGKNKKSKYGRLNLCKKCASNVVLKSRYGGNHKMKEGRHPRGTFNNRREATIYRKYKLLPEELKDFLKKNNNKCQICLVGSSHPRNRGQGNLSIDHCHATGKVRGLLCSTCNTTLGSMNDDIKLFMKSIEYLTLFS